MTDYERGFAAAIEAAAKVCEQMQNERDGQIPQGAWTTLGTTEISGRKFAYAIRALQPSREFVVLPREPTNDMLDILKDHADHKDGNHSCYARLLRAAEGGGE